jgi:cyanate lyase
MNVSDLPGTKNLCAMPRGPVVSRSEVAAEIPAESLNSNSRKLVATVTTPNAQCGDGKHSCKQSVTFDHSEEKTMKRSIATELILEAKQKKGLTFTEIARQFGRSRSWVTAALLGQATMTADEAGKAVEILGLSPEVALPLQEIPTRGVLNQPIPTDPTLYRFYEMLQLYSTTFKALVHETFGDGIMSAVDFEFDVARVEDPKGDRVVITLNGKFLPFRKW